MSRRIWPWSGERQPILQTEAAECGLASLAMVANFHGHDLDLITLRKSYPMSLKGMTLKQVMAIAATLDFATRAVRLEVDELDQLKLPAILHWDLNHFVVLESVNGGHASILDPAKGRRRLGLATVGKHFTGVALELQPTTRFVPVTARSKLRLTDLWSRVANFARPAAQILLLSLVIQLAAVVAPFFVQLVIDEAIAQGDLSLLTLLAVAFGLALVFQAVVRALRNWVTMCLGQSLSYQLAGNVVHHLLKLPVGFFERRHIGDVMSRLGGVQPVQRLLSHGFINALVDAGLFAIILLVMLLISPVLTLIVVAGNLMHLAASQAFQPLLQRRTEEELVARAEESSYLMESIRSVRAIKLHTHEAMRENGWRNRFARVITASYGRETVDIRLGLVEEVALSLSYVLIVYLGAKAVLAGDLSVGMLVAFLSYRATFTQSAVALVQQFREWKLLSVHLERLSDVVLHQREEVRGPVERKRGASPSIAVSNLSFAYSAGEEPVLENVDFTIPSGALVAIVGPSGAGKSTLLRLLLGMAPPDRGAIVVDGAELSEQNLGSWRSRIGAVMQDDYLLSGSIGDNICFFDPHPDQARIESAAQFACIHDDIMAMPMGYQSLINDMGAALSAGQRQRIMLARAIYRQPDVLFLDEGTANLDPATEAKIAEAVARLPITRVVIAHRPALVEHADYILKVSDRGARLSPAGGVAKAPATRSRFGQFEAAK